MSFEFRERRGSAVTLILAILVLGPLSFLLHEFAHWSAGEALGVDMWMTLNKAGPEPGQERSLLQAFVTAMSGPVITYLLAIAGWIWVVRGGGMIAYGLVFFQLMQRTVAGGITMMGNHPNDEAAAGMMMGIGPYPLTIAAMIGLLALTWDAARRARPGIARNIFAYLASSLVITGFVFADQFLRGDGFRLL